MVERNVFLEDHDDMFDRRRGGNPVKIIRIAAVPIIGERARGCESEARAEAMPRVDGKRIGVAS